MLWQIVLCLLISAVLCAADIYVKRHLPEKYKKVYNRGAFLGLLSKHKKLLIVIQSIMILIMIAFVIFIEEFELKIILSVALGGSLGNYLERLIYGKVTDYLKVGKVFVNFADICIFSCIIALIIYMVVI